MVPEIKTEKKNVGKIFVNLDNRWRTSKAI